MSVSASRSCSTIDSTEHVLSARWKLDEETLRGNIWKVLKLIQAHRDHFIYFDPKEFKAGQVHLLSVDTVSYPWQEVRIDPGKKWYDHKTNSAGVKYEMALPLCLGRVS